MFKYLTLIWIWKLLIEAYSRISVHDLMSWVPCQPTRLGHNSGSNGPVSAQFWLHIGQQNTGRPIGSCLSVLILFFLFQAVCYDDMDCPIGHCCSETPNGYHACAPERKMGDICTLSISDERVLSDFHVPTCSCGRGLECTSVIGEDFGFCLPTRALLADPQ